MQTVSTLLLVAACFFAGTPAEAKTASSQKPVQDSVVTDSPKKEPQRLDYTAKVCGFEVFNLKSDIISYGNPEGTDMRYDLEAFRPITKTTKTSLAYGLMLASLDAKISDDMRIFLVTQFIQLYTDINNPSDVKLSNDLIEEMKRVQLKPFDCKTPDKSMKFISDAFRNARIYSGWLHEYNMYMLQLELYQNNQQYQD